MIEKLDLDKRKSFGLLDWFAHNGEPSGAGLVGSKINELVDAVNVLQAQVAILEENAHPTAKTDPYAEQRKWIGKLCRFRDNNDDKWNYNTLKSIININCSFPFKDAEDYEWAICEPVKPDDDIIYKGE